MPFGRILVGVDGTDQGLVACRQVARLAEESALIEAVTVVNLAEVVLVGPDAPRVAGELRQEAESALDQALAILGDRAERRLLQGLPAPELRAEVDRTHATLLAIGTHGHSRASEIVLGGTAGELLHEARCSVLVARATDDEQLFPRSVVAGTDGSAHGDAAVAVAEGVAGRFGAELRVLTSLQHAVAALVEAARDTDLLIVGSRGLHGLRALGSVSERVAHQAGCSVLVVR